ncbi:hypothetical protein ACFQXB_10850 [Plastorhodobacter daqingensis]|uniref:Uncharacterized protein n=1 Tax=Plastorhodobacter daqingensis TaxID=1387281 RepID=A0ABW2UKV5_9RHOB
MRIAKIDQARATLVAEQLGLDYYAPAVAAARSAAPAKGAAVPSPVLAALEEMYAYYAAA